MQNHTSTPWLSLWVGLTGLILAACQHSGGEPAPKSQSAGMFGALDENSFAALHELSAEAAPAPRGQVFELSPAAALGGTPNLAYLAKPEHPLLGNPALIVIHEWWGLNDHIKHWADRLAADGYFALAIDLYAGRVATTREEASQLYSSVDLEQGKRVLRAAHAYLTDTLHAKRSASIGWCFGGHWSLRAGIELPELDGAVIYYGVPIEDPAELKQIQARLLCIFGNLDQSIPPAMVDSFDQALTGAGVEHRLLRYEAEHAFANPSSARYDSPSAGAAWEEVRVFLSEVLLGSP